MNNCIARNTSDLFTGDWIFRLVSSAVVEIFVCMCDVVMRPVELTLLTVT